MSKASHAVKISIYVFLTIIVMAAGWHILSNQTASAAGTIRVAGSIGVDHPTCGTQATPCKTIQYAVDKAASGDTILVASGIYTYDASNSCNIGTGNIGVVCFADKNLTILGGYTTSNWTNADPEVNPTVIDGENTHRGLVVVAYSTQVNFRMEGFTIRNGYYQGLNDSNSFFTDAKGGGLWSQGASITLRDMIFESNQVKGGYNTGLNIGGAADGGGLAITASPNKPTNNLIERITFTNNRATGGNGGSRGGFALGGALFVYSANLTATDITVTGNAAQAGSTTQGGIYQGTYADALGGGISVQGGSTVTFTNLMLTGNRAIGGDAGTFDGAWGGGAFGGALHVEKSTINMAQAHFEENAAIGGDGHTGGFAFSGAFELIDTNGTLNRIAVINNKAISGSTSGGGSAGAPSGGGAYISSTTGPGKAVTINNCLYAENELVLGSGANPGGGGGGMVVQGLIVNLNHCTFSGNTMNYLNNGVAVLAQDAADSTPGVVHLNHSIVANHGNYYRQVAVFITKGSTGYLNKTIFSGNQNDTNDGLVGYLEQGDIIGYDPSLVFPSVDFISPGPPNYDYHLRSTSPAIDKAVGSAMPEDIDGEPRPAGAERDIGVDEYVVPALTASPDSVVVLATGSTPVLRWILVETNTTYPVAWTASTMPRVPSSRSVEIPEITSLCILTRLKLATASTMVWFPLPAPVQLPQQSM